MRTRPMTRTMLRARTPAVRSCPRRLPPVRNSASTARAFCARWRSAMTWAPALSWPWAALSSATKAASRPTASPAHSVPRPRPPAQPPWTRRACAGSSIIPRSSPRELSRNGVTSALVVHAGWNGLDDIFTGPDNFFQAYAPKSQRARLVEKLGEEYEITRTDIKKWTVGSPIQGPLDAIEAIRGKTPFDADQVKKVAVRLAPSV